MTSAWYRLEKGIIAGCTMSGVLVCLGKEHACQSLEVECRGLLSRSGMCQLPIRTFMDNLIATIISARMPMASPRAGKGSLLGQEWIWSWPNSEPWSWGREDCPTNTASFWEGVRIPLVSENPVKRLGKIFVYTLGDTAMVQSTCRKLKSAVDKSRLPGKFKAWIYQHQYPAKTSLVTAHIWISNDHHGGLWVKPQPERCYFRKTQLTLESPLQALQVRTGRK